MWRNALFATAATLMGLGTIMLTFLDYLIPYKRVLFQTHGVRMAVFSMLLAINLYAFYFVVTRKMLLKDSGRKFSHIEKQVREGSVFHELSERLSEEG
jgi:hypothetical protein